MRIKYKGKYFSENEFRDILISDFSYFFPFADGSNTTFDPNNPDIRYATGGGIPDRYKNMGFSKVGQKKKSTRPQKKWMVLAKKGDKYKVVHGGQKGMEDFSQHRDKNRQKRFWNRMGGFDSEKASDPFSPLYWHKRFGTWEKGGVLEDGAIKVAWIDAKEPETLESKMFDNIDDALKYAEGKTFLIMELEEQDDDYYKWNLLPYGEHERYKGIVNWMNIFEEVGVVENDDFSNSENAFLQTQTKSTDKINREFNPNNPDIRYEGGGKLKTEKPESKSRIQLSKHGRSSNSDYLSHKYRTNYLVGGKIWYKETIDDSEYRFIKEISDIELEKPYFLEEIIKHDKLFEKYPHIRKIIVIFEEIESDDDDADSYTNISQDGNHSIIIRLHFSYYKKHNHEKFKLGTTKYPEFSKEATLLHELQHVLQFGARGYSLFDGRSRDQEIASACDEYSCKSLEDAHSKGLRLKVELSAHFAYITQRAEQEARWSVDMWLKKIGLEYGDKRFLIYDDESKFKQLFEWFADLKDKHESGGLINSVNNKKEQTFQQGADIKKHNSENNEPTGTNHSGRTPMGKNTPSAKSIREKTTPSDIKGINTHASKEIEGGPNNTRIEPTTGYNNGRELPKDEFSYLSNITKESIQDVLSGKQKVIHGNSIQGVLTHLRNKGSSHSTDDPNSENQPSQKDHLKVLGNISYEKFKDIQRRIPNVSLEEMNRAGAYSLLRQKPVTLEEARAQAILVGIRGDRNREDHEIKRHLEMWFLNSTQEEIEKDHNEIKNIISKANKRASTNREIARYLERKKGILERDSKIIEEDYLVYYYHGGLLYIWNFWRGGFDEIKNEDFDSSGTLITQSEWLSDIESAERVAQKEKPPLYDGKIHVSKQEIKKTGADMAQGGTIQEAYKKQIDDYRKEGIFIKPTDNPIVESLPISRFNGPNADILPSQEYVYRRGVAKWKIKIREGERPHVLINIDQKGIPRVKDGHHRLKAYEELGFTEIPVIDVNGKILIGSKIKERENIAKSMQSGGEILKYNSILEMPKEERIAFIEKTIREDPFYTERKGSYNLIASEANEIVENFFHIDKDNPIYIKGDRVYFEPDKRMIDRDGYLVAQAKYAAHFPTIKSGKERFYAHHKTGAVKNITMSFKNPIQRLFQKEGGKIVYITEVKTDNLCCMILEIKVNENGALSVVTTYPDKSWEYVKIKKASGVWTDASFSNPNEQPPAIRVVSETNGDIDDSRTQDKDINNNDTHTNNFNNGGIIKDDLIKTVEKHGKIKRKYEIEETAYKGSGSATMYYYNKGLYEIITWNADATEHDPHTQTIFIEDTEIGKNIKERERLANINRT